MKMSEIVGKSETELRNQEKPAYQLVLVVADILPGGGDAIYIQSLDPIVHQTHGNIAHGIRVVGHNLPHRAVGILHQGGGGDLLFFHDQTFEGVPGAGTLFPADEVDGVRRQAQVGPVFDSPQENEA